MGVVGIGLALVGVGVGSLVATKRLLPRLGLSEEPLPPLRLAIALLAAGLITVGIFAVWIELVVD